ncbi:MAG: Na+/H+ antiporter subunit E [Pseudotabrizicola sp.]|uniref:Na+/H+ antiporter subunit E n=1 Tax=Pseudotabrizicola sp. TaxID=2939647 RepID=UPI00271BF917|nr:Na+/H+ antiporter subunit E [Pseudotabrizicola sp.]MDO8882296.1 Na+/H+ antiporter subunit E [Pseudotabrizicola sp.]MDP2079925.1 Na+/H+ antiporter subunit E [Pseudotabrizicola sp.]MDZ7575664.1 Na+/H+ antiporter subunit E [Pseudotabrizicola sp.]
MLRRLFPHPLLSLLLVVSWLLLVNQFKIGSLVMAVILAIIIPKLTAPYWPNRPPLKHIPAFAAYVLLVIWDIVLANIQVARIVLFMRNENIRSGWLAVPIDLKSPEAITILAGTITMTPGTVTSDMSSCGRVLLVHALHAPDPASVIHDIKTRYEARLKRIFE